MPEHPTPEDERRARLLEEFEIPALLARALDRVPDAWALLYAQSSLARAGKDGQEPEALRNAVEALPRGNPTTRHLRLQERRVRKHLEYLEARGFGFDWSRGLLTIRSGGRPRHFLSALVAALDSEICHDARRLPRAAKLRRMARLLAPFFGPEWTTTDSKGLLARTLDNVDPARRD